jgi:hypothetical protein
VEDAVSRNSCYSPACGDGETNATEKSTLGRAAARQETEAIARIRSREYPQMVPDGGDYLANRPEQTIASLPLRCRRDGVEVAWILLHLRKQTGIIVEQLA